MPVLPPFQALVLRSYETGNTSEVVQVLSGEHGRLSVYCRGLRRKGNRFRAVLQTLAVVEVVASQGSEGAMPTLREATALSPQDAWERDLGRFALAMALAEAAAESCGEGQPVPELFATLLEGLERLQQAPAEPEGAALTEASAALLRVMEEAGEGPALDPELTRPWPAEKPRPECFWLDLDSGFIHTPGTRAEDSAVRWRTPRVRDGGVPLPPAAVRLVYTLQRGGEAPLLDAVEGRALFEGLLRFFEYRAGHGLRSAGFWRGMERLPK